MGSEVRGDRKGKSGTKSEKSQPRRLRLKVLEQGFPGGPVAKILCSNAGVQVQSLVTKSSPAASKDPTCSHEDPRSHMPQLRPGADKEINIF